MNIKRCVICNKIIDSERVARFPAVITCDSVCRVAYREGISREESNTMRLREIRRKEEADSQLPWPEPEPPPKLDLFNNPNEDRAYQS